MIYLRHLFILSLLISNNYLHAEENQKSCLNLIKQNQCLQAIEACKVEAENNDPKAQTALGMLLSGITHGDYRKNYNSLFFGLIKQLSKAIARHKLL